MSHTQVEELPNLTSWADELIAPKIPDGITLDISARLEFLKNDPSILENSEVNESLGVISRLSEKDPESAYAELISIIDIYPDNPKVRQLGVKIATKLGKLEEAYEHAILGLNEDPRATILWLPFIGVSLDTERHSEALWAINTYQDLFPDKLMMLQKFLHKRMPDYIPPYPEAPKEKSTEVVISVSGFRKTQGENRQAIIELHTLDNVTEEFVNERILSAFPREYNFLLAAALTLVIKKKYALAIKVADAGLPLGEQEGTSALHTVAANSLYRLEKHEEALDYVKKGQEIHLNYDLAISGLKLSLALDRSDDTEIYAKKVLELSPTDPLASQTLGSIAFSEGNFIEAREWFSAYFSNFQTASRSIFVQMIALELLAEDYEKAKKAVDLMSKKCTSDRLFLHFAKLFIDLTEQLKQDNQSQLHPSVLLENYLRSENSKTKSMNALVIARFSGVIDEEYIANAQNALNSHSEDTTSEQSEDDQLSRILKRSLGIRTSTFFKNAHRLRPVNKVAKTVVAKRKDSE